MIQVYSLKTNSDSDIWSSEELLNILTPKRKAKALRFRHSGDQWRGIMTGILEEFTLQQCFGIPWKEQNIEAGINGKPYVAERPELHYNLSHSGDWVVCAAAYVSVGIDVEQTDKYSERVVKRFFHEHEIRDVMEQDETIRPDIFAEYWTMKESFMKLSGMGFELQLKQFATNRQTGEACLLEPVPSELQKAGVIETGICRFLPLEAGYRLTVCTRQPQEIRHQTVTVEECIRDLSK